MTHYDCDPSNGDSIYVNCLKQSDSRQLQEETGCCDDADLEILVFLEQREKTERIKIYLASIDVLTLATSNY